MNNLHMQKARRITKHAINLQQYVHATTLKEVATTSRDFVLKGDNVYVIHCGILEAAIFRLTSGIFKHNVYY